MNLIKLYTFHGPVWVDAEQLNGPRTMLTIYTLRGNKLSDVAKTKADRERASYGVHRENLFASPELAERHHNGIISDMQKRTAASIESVGAL